MLRGRASEPLLPIVTAWLWLPALPTVTEWEWPPAFAIAALSPAPTAASAPEWVVSLPVTEPA